MNQYDDDRLAALLTDAVDDVEPADRLADIRERTRVVPISRRRPWLLVTGGAIVATAAVVTAIALATGSLTSAPDEPAPGTDVPSQTPSRATEPTQGGALQAVPVYLAGDTPFGTRLYREFVPVDASEDPAEAAVRLSVQGGGADPDYRTLWPDGVDVDHVEATPDLITVSLLGAPHDLPPGVDEADAALAIEQVIYTAQGAVQQGRLPVRLLLDGQISDQVLGQPTSEPLANAPLLDTLSRVQLSSPSEGQIVPVDGTLHVSGAANSFEANVVWRVQRWEATDVVDQGYFSTTGYMEPKLFPFEDDIDLAGVPAGRYLLIVSTDDPSGEGNFYTDTRQIVIE